MAKTDFQNGTVVTSTFLDTIYQTNGGHKHDGVDDDGHASKIDLSSAAEVSGTLPLANVESIGSDDVANESTGSGSSVTDVIDDHETQCDNYETDEAVLEYNSI